MDRTELILNSIDTNVFQSQATSAGYVNPTLWNREVLKSVQSQLVITQFAKVYNDLLSEGATLNITVGVEPTAASALTETTAVTIDSFTYTQVVFTPSEYGAAYQISDKEARRSFFSLMEDVTQKLGYRLARKREQFAEALLRTGAGQSVVVNGVASSAVASTDTLAYNDIVNAIGKIENQKFTTQGGVLFIHPLQKRDLMKQAAFYQSYQYGGREVIYNGEIGMIAGLRVVVAHEINVTSSTAMALLLGRHPDGTPPFGMAIKAEPRIETDRRAVDRVTDIVASEEWDMQLLYSNAICTIKSYCA